MTNRTNPLTTAQLTRRLFFNFACDGWLCWTLLVDLRAHSHGWAIFAGLALLYTLTVTWRDLHWWKTPLADRKRPILKRHNNSSS